MCHIIYFSIYIYININTFWACVLFGKVLLKYIFLIIYWIILNNTLYKILYILQKM